MNKQSEKLIKVIATGIIVLILFSLALFWGRLFCNFTLLSNVPESSLRIVIRPSGLVAGEPHPQQVQSEPEYLKRYAQPNEPNFRYSQMNAQISRGFGPSKSIGTFWDIVDESIKSIYVKDNKIYYWHSEKENNYVCLDKSSGLIIRRHTFSGTEPNDEEISGQDELFAGPNGISRTVDSSLGRFYNPIVTGGWWGRGDPNRIGLYDKVARRFYIIDFVEGSVSKGLQLAKEDSREPIAIGRIDKNIDTFSDIIWRAPEIWKADENAAKSPEEQMDVSPGEWKQREAILPGNFQLSERYIYRGWFDWTCTFIPVLDKTGLVYIYNSKEQSLTRCGYLPQPQQSPFEAEQLNETANPRDVLDYQVWPVYAVLKSPLATNKPEKIVDVKYLGMCVASISRGGTAMTAAIFDPNGKLAYRGDTKTKEGRSSAEAVYDGAPRSSFWTSILILLENLQPAVFELASYLCADCFEASAGHRALFILPNSFLGMLSRADTQDSILGKQAGAFLLMAPSLILSVWLALRVRKNAEVIGLSGTAKKWWLIGTIAFGLPAYITYRLTRPKETLVTCANCGKMRRPDMEKCHRCGAGWKIPEMTPPNWRICD
jgi:hypothetical protein